MTEHRTPDQIFESSPRSFGVGSKIGDHLTNAAGRLSELDARQTSGVSQVPDCKKLALRLPTLPDVTLTFVGTWRLFFDVHADWGFRMSPPPCPSSSSAGQSRDCLSTAFVSGCAFRRAVTPAKQRRLQPLAGESPNKKAAHAALPTNQESRNRPQPTFRPLPASSSTSSRAFSNRCARCTIADDPTLLFRFSR